MFSTKQNIDEVYNKEQVMNSNILLEDTIKTIGQLLWL